MEDKKTVLAGIDIGGTNTRIALSTPGNADDIIIQKDIKTNRYTEPESMVQILAELIASCLQESGRNRNDLGGVGCVIPGIVNPDNGRVIEVANLPGWEGFPFRDSLRSRIDCPVLIENDVNAAAFGEYKLGSGKGSRVLVYFTVSTGVAAGIVIEGRLIQGAHFSAGEMGYFVPDSHLLDKDWSPNGCLEMHAGGIGIAKQWAEKRGGEVNSERAREVFDAARNEDKDAGTLVRQAGNYLAQAALGLCTVVDPDVLILGGSIAEHEPAIRNRIIEVLQEMLLFPPEIRNCLRPGGAPMLGALALAEEACF